MKDNKIIFIPPTKPTVKEGGLFQNFLENKTRLRIAAYCRVSTDMENQENSFAEQMRYFSDYISSNPNWTLVGIYADEAQSGTSRKNRTGFNKMMRDALSGQIDYIITKSISRFSRNQHDMYECIKALKNHQPPIGVYFQNENLDSLDSSTEFVFTILSLVAQNQSQSISMNIQWSIEKKFAAGGVYADPSRIYGYKRGAENEWVIDEEKASVVRFIYDRFSELQKYRKIARELNEADIPSPRGNCWRSDAIITILCNEKYVGDVINQKTFTKDYLTHQAVENRGERPKYYIRDHHPAIIERAQWDLTQEQIRNLRKKRNQKPMETKGRSDSNRFGLIRCGRTENEVRFGRFMSAKNGYSSWRCNVKRLKTMRQQPFFDAGCASCTLLLSEIGIEQSFMEAMYRLKREQDTYGKNSELERAFRQVENHILNEYDYSALEEEYQNSIEETAVLKESLEKFIEQRNLNRTIDYPAGIKICDRIIQSLKADIAEHALEQEGLEEKIQKPERYRGEFCAFVDMLACLPMKIASGESINVNGFNGIESKRRTFDGKVKRKIGRKITAETVQKAPNYLRFLPSVFDRFIVSGTVWGDEIEYLTSFGIKISTIGNSRKNNAFIGFRYTTSDGILRYINEVRDIPQKYY